MSLRRPSADTGAIVAAALRSLRAICRPGYPTKTDEVNNAQRGALVEGVVPDSPHVRALLDTLKAHFPALEVDHFLVTPIGL